MNLKPADLETRLTESYAKLRNRVESQAMTEMTLIEAQTRLVEKRARILRETDAKTLGANEAQREAALAEQCQPEIEGVAEAEKARVNIRAEVEIARLHVDEARHLLRVYELAVLLH